MNNKRYVEISNTLISEAIDIWISGKQMIKKMLESEDIMRLILSFHVQFSASTVDEMCALQDVAIISKEFENIVMKYTTGIYLPFKRLSRIRMGCFIKKINLNNLKVLFWLKTHFKVIHCRDRGVLMKFLTLLETFQRPLEQFKPTNIIMTDYMPYEWKLTRERYEDFEYRSVDKINIEDDKKVAKYLDVIVIDYHHYAYYDEMEKFCGIIENILMK